MCPNRSFGSPTETLQHDAPPQMEEIYDLEAASLNALRCARGWKRAPVRCCEERLIGSRA